MSQLFPSFLPSSLIIIFLPLLRQVLPHRVRSDYLAWPRPLLIESDHFCSHMGITAIEPERGDVDRIIDVLREVILEATSRR